MASQGNNSKTAQVQSQVDEVVGIMQENIHKVVQRGEQLESLQNKTGKSHVFLPSRRPSKFFFTI